MAYNAHNTKVRACGVQNDTDGDIHVLFTYEQIASDNGEMKQTRAELDIPKGQKKYVHMKIVTRDTHNIIEVIDHIEVTRNNGNKLELKAPFHGVKTPVSDWIFTVNNTEIKSTGNSNK